MTTPTFSRAASTTSLYAPHGEPGAFFNPWSRSDRTLLDLLRWKLLSRNPYGRHRSPVVPRAANDGAALAAPEAGAALTWVGHSTFLLHEGDDVVLTDPHFGPRALLPPRLVAPGVPLEAVPSGAFVVLSHNHYDHLDTWTVERLPPETDFYVPLGLAGWFRRHGRERVVELDWWQSVRRGRWTLTCLPAQHWSNRLRTKRNATLWCSWLLDSGSRRYYFAGDSGYFHGFAEIGRRFSPIDVALLPIGAYEPRWFMRYQHMDPAEAYRAFLDLRARFLVPMHWGTFDLTDEPADLPPQVLARHAAGLGGDERLRILAVGQRWECPATGPEPQSA